MAKRPNTLWDYVRAAFNAKPRVPGLGDVPANWLFLLATGVASLAMGPGALVIGAGVELGYLAAMAHNGRFRKFVDSTGTAQNAVDWMQRKIAIVQQLDEPSRRRYQALEARCAEALSLASKLSMVEQSPLDSQTAEGLSRLTWIFLKLQVSRLVAMRQLAETRAEDLEAQIQHHQQQLTALIDDPGKERLKKSIEATLEIVKKRYDNLKAASDNVEYINAELNRIEQQVMLMLQEFSGNRDVSSLLTKVDAISGTLKETQDWMKLNAEVLGAEEEAELDEAPPLGLPTPQRSR